MSITSIKLYSRITNNPTTSCPTDAKLASGATGAPPPIDRPHNPPWPRAPAELSLGLLGSPRSPAAAAVRHPLHQRLIHNQTPTAPQSSPPSSSSSARARWWWWWYCWWTHGWPDLGQLSVRAADDAEPRVPVSSDWRAAAAATAAASQGRAAGSQQFRGLPQEARHSRLAGELYYVDSVFFCFFVFWLLGISFEGLLGGKKFYVIRGNQCRAMKIFKLIKLLFSHLEIINSHRIAK